MSTKSLLFAWFLLVVNPCQASDALVDVGSMTITKDSLSRYQNFSNNHDEDKSLSNLIFLIAVSENIINGKLIKPSLIEDESYIDFSSRLEIISTLGLELPDVIVNPSKTDIEKFYQHISNGHVITFIFKSFETKNDASKFSGIFKESDLDTQSIENTISYISMETGIDVDPKDCNNSASPPTFTIQKGWTIWKCQKKSFVKNKLFSKLSQDEVESITESYVSIRSNIFLKKFIHDSINDVSLKWYIPQPKSWLSILDSQNIRH